MFFSEEVFLAKPNATIKELRSIAQRLSAGEILGEEEVRLWSQTLSTFMDREFPHMAGKWPGDSETIIRFVSLSRRFKEAREAIGLTLKEAAARIKAPQYRVRAIEMGLSSSLDPNVVLRYSEMLGIRPWLAKWVAANAEFAQKIGIGRLAD